MSRSDAFIGAGFFVASVASGILIAKVQADTKVWYAWILTNRWVVPTLFSISVFFFVRERNGFRKTAWRAMQWFIPGPDVGANNRLESAADDTYRIDFDYIRNSSGKISPLNKGWKKAYGDGVPDFGSDPEIPGSLSLKVNGDKYAMAYEIPQHAKLYDRVTFEAKFIKQAIFYMEIEVIDRNGLQPKTLWFSHVIGQKAPEYYAEWNEWKFYVLPIGKRFNLGLTQEVETVLGHEGKILSEIKKVQIRGDMSISTITLSNSRLPSPQPAFDPIQLSDVKAQVDSLSSYERLALKQLIVKDGMTGGHFYQFLAGQGFPVSSLMHQHEIEGVFDNISSKTTLLDRNYTTGHWFVKAGLAKAVRHALSSES